mmetsp:Transcript_9448/g.22394  ORF Transcript_9448/g.22394 Transcript_9448/m.22394 type:complete len:687 (+) Transcript_9448:23-2083(+)
MEVETQPDRRWFFLGGEFRDAAGGRTTDPGEAQFPSDAWCEYDAEVSFQLSESYQSLLERGEAGDSKMLDLSMFSDPPLPYQIWHGRQVPVRHPSAPSRLQGKDVVGGFRSDFWTRLESKVPMLPRLAAQWVDMGVAKVVGGFYQIHQDHLRSLDELLRWLGDASGQSQRPGVEPRKRIVLMIEFPAGWHRKTGQSSSAKPAGQDVAPLEEGDPPVYEWWYGDRPPQSECLGRQLRGFWRRYHPAVCRRLEQIWQHNMDFRECRVGADIDGVQYMMQRITAEKPFVGTGGQGSGGPFDERHVITVDYPCYEELDRVTVNCLVQFRRGDCNRRRPARRRMNAEEIARNAARTGKPCCICFSEPGEVTGCEQLHVICGDCLRSGLRSMVGDITVLENLLCGCFSHASRGTVYALAERSDAKLQEALANPASGMATILLEDELQATRRQFDLGTDAAIPPTLYSAKVKDWYDKVIQQQIMPNYYVCSHPACADEIANWMLREHFDAEYRSQGKFEWSCPLGHTNTVLPMKDEIAEMNRTLLLHPEYYVASASCDGCPLRRFRLCRECVEGSGVLMLAVHAEGCKQWPGGGSAHRHCFCFSCTRPWGSQCGHGTVCADPGVQQVRSRGGHLEIGHVDGAEYLRWLGGERPEPPPTEFSAEPLVADGAERQRELGMEDRSALLAESQMGTD